MASLFISEKNKILGALTRFLACAGIVAYAPSMYAVVHEALWPIAVIDTIAYATILLSAFHPRSTFSVKLSVLVSMSMGMGVVVLVQTGPLGAGYIWLLAASVLSALFGSKTVSVLTNTLGLLFMAVWGLALGFGWVEGYGATPLTVLIIGTSLALVEIGLTIVIRELLDKLGQSICAQKDASDRIAAELERSERMAGDLDQALAEKDSLLRELHHRVKNNLQTVLSIMGMADMEDPNVCGTVKRRIRGLAVVNELALSNHNAVTVNARELLRAVASRNTENCFPNLPAVSVTTDTSVELDTQLAGLVAIVGGDVAAALLNLSERLFIGLRGQDGSLLAEFRLPAEFTDERAKAAYDKEAASPIVTKAAPDIRLEFAPGTSELGPGIVLMAGNA
ncbi:MAG: sensor histidine kinase [Spirochaetia bacterium]|nr:sensor histidine kinase [Spirochaetia bacterium]